MKENQVQFCRILFMILYIIFVVLGLYFLYICFKLEPQFYNDREKYDSIMEMNEEDILEIKDYEKNKFNYELMEHLSLLFAKFARYPYNKDSYYYVKRFLNFDIINYGSKSDDNYFFTFKNDSLKIVIISFPGTLTIPQLLDEAFGSGLTSFDESKQILIGKYFGKRAESLLELIFNDELEKLIKNNYQLISTGHSLGGAMAQSFMYFALSKGKINKNNIPMTITFGQPKVGNIYFSSYLDNNTFLNLRFINKNDLVTKIPFCSGFFNHIQYFFNILDNNDKIYFHTKTEYIQQNICNLPTIIFIFIKFVELVVFLFKLLVLLIPIIFIIYYLYSIFYLYSTIKNKCQNKYFYILFLVLFGAGFILFIYFYYDFKKYTCLTSIICVILIIILLSIVILLIIFFVAAVILLIINLSDCSCKCEEEEKKIFFEYCNCTTICNCISLIFSGLYDAFFHFTNIIPHTKYQNSNDTQKQFGNLNSIDEERIHSIM